MDADLVIVGGGIIGLLSAYELAQSGVKVTLIDKGEPGQESSWAAGGILSPLLPWDYDSKVSSLSQDNLPYYQTLSDLLLLETGIDIELWQCGLSVIKPENSHRALQWCKNNNTACFIDNKGSLPQLNLPHVNQLRTPRLLHALVNYLIKIGVTVLSNTNVNHCHMAGQQVTSIETSAGHISTRQLLICAGAWSSKMFNTSIDIELPKITPVLGQIIAFQNNAYPLDTILYNNGHYLIPRKDGLILAGSTLEYVGYSKSITEEARMDLYERSIQLIPELAHSKIAHHWSGLRPGSLNNHPIIGPHPSIEGLYFNCGHFRYGIAMAPKSAMTIRKWIKEESVRDLEKQYLLKTGNQIP